MNLTSLIGFMMICAGLNRGRGSHYGGTIDSTVVSRLLTTFALAVLTMLSADSAARPGELILLWVWAGLSLWAFPGWDNYWSAAIGNPVNAHARTFLPADWLLEHMPWFAPVYNATASARRCRLWGVVAMGLRQALAAPCLVGLAYLTGHPEAGWYAMATLLFGLPYLLTGYACKTDPVGYAEYVVGGLLGLLIYAILH